MHRYKSRKIFHEKGSLTKNTNTNCAYLKQFARKSLLLAKFEEFQNACNDCIEFINDQMENLDNLNNSVLKIMKEYKHVTASTKADLARKFAQIIDESDDDSEECETDMRVKFDAYPKVDKLVSQTITNPCFDQDTEFEYSSSSKMKQVVYYNVKQIPESTESDIEQKPVKPDERSMEVEVEFNKQKENNDDQST